MRWPSCGRRRSTTRRSRGPGRAIPGGSSTLMRRRWPTRSSGQSVLKTARAFRERRKRPAAWRAMPACGDAAGRGGAASRSRGADADIPLPATGALPPRPGLSCPGLQRPCHPGPPPPALARRRATTLSNLLCSGRRHTPGRCTRRAIGSSAGRTTRCGSAAGWPAVPDGCLCRPRCPRIVRRAPGASRRAGPAGARADGMPRLARGGPGRGLGDRRVAPVGRETEPMSATARDRTRQPGGWAAGPAPFHRVGVKHSGRAILSAQWTLCYLRPHLVPSSWGTLPLFMSTSGQGGCLGLGQAGEFGEGERLGLRRRDARGGAHRPRPLGPVPRPEARALARLSCVAERREADRAQPERTPTGTGGARLTRRWIPRSRPGRRAEGRAAP